MFMLNHLAGFNAAAAALVIPASASFIALTHDSTDTATPSYAGASIGVADATRRVVVVFHWGVTNAARTVTSATIAGVAATIHAQVTNGPTAAQQNTGVAIFSALVPSGTTGTIAITLNGTVLRSSIAVYRQINELNASPHDTVTDNTVAGTVLSGTIDVPATGMLYAGSANAATAGSTNTWVGVTENYDAAHPEAGGLQVTGGHATGLSLQAGSTVSDTATGTIPRGAMVAVSWG
jgi:hypothetical protein